MIEKRRYKVDEERYKNEDNEKLFKKYNDYFYKVIQNPRAKQDLFLIKVADIIICQSFCNKKKEIMESEENQYIRDSLVNYMKYLRAKFQVEENEKKLKGKKLIII